MHCPGVGGWDFRITVVLLLFWFRKEALRKSERPENGSGLIFVLARINARWFETTETPMSHIINVGTDTVRHWSLCFTLLRNVVRRETGSTLAGMSCREVANKDFPPVD